MKVLGIVLIIAGILMMVFTQVNFTTTKKVVDAGPVQIDKKENHSIGWPVYAGAVAVVGGIAVLLVGRKKS
ncbi:MAG TPA: hypothetical protein VG738_23310 [Chitinophagaceae bacterium]|nr:hypothetical protein [Chitinophagaceae bacterium]